MLQLFNYCPILGEYEYCTEDLEKFLQTNSLHGIELFVYDKDRNFKSSKHLVKGVHLRYWPYWLDFWQGNTAELRKEFDNQASLRDYYWGAVDCKTWLKQIKSNICMALGEAPEYLVWHVANANLCETYTMDFEHTDVEVLQAAAELFNSVADCIPEHICVLFENLWWPGLRLTEPQAVADFFADLQHSNTGIMLDLGHLMSTNPHLEKEEQGYAYAQTIIKNLGGQAQKIRGVHLNYSLSGEYVRNLNKQVPERFDVGSMYEHVSKIDQHLACRHQSLSGLIELIKPEYLVHELFYNSLEDLQTKIQTQQAAIAGYKMEE